jgi:hypothetical protein
LAFHELKCGKYGTPLAKYPARAFFLGRLAMTLRAFIFIIFILIALPFKAIATNPLDLDTYLHAFNQNPKKVMNDRLPKRDRNGRVINKVESNFTDEEVRTGDFIRSKDKVRLKIIEHADAETFSAIQDRDRVEDLVQISGEILRNVSQMDGAALQNGRTPMKPWGDWYWPFYRGLLGARYADPEFPRGTHFPTNYNYVLNRGAWSIFDSGPDARIDNLSPSEKYDLIMGDSGLSLTAASWRRGQSFQDQSGTVATWMGICEGWAAASIMTPGPVRRVSVATPMGKSVTFYPSDLRGLASLLWSSAAPRMRFISTRCNVKQPAQNANGRIIDQACFDPNPGTWHMTVVNQLGLGKKPFIMDSRYDYEVWNRPVISYKITYFNPQTSVQSQKAAAVTIPKALFTRDKFSEFRSDDARFVVGVSMDVTYASELRSHHLEGSSFSSRIVKYVYDLELNAEGKIIGGEWYTNSRPDFLYKPPEGSRAISFADYGLDPRDWDGQSPVPQQWREHAKEGATRNQPLAVVVERLMQRAQ